METIKVTVLCLALCALAACGNKETSDMDESELRRECEQLRQDREKALENNVEAQELIDNIFNSVNTLSGRKASLERSLGDNSISDSRLKAEEIAQDIEAIKEKLERAEELENFDKSTKIILAKLRSTVEQKEQEINELRRVIQEKDEQIQQLGEQVTTLDTELGNTNQQLSDTRDKLKANEINSWIRMGDELISAAQMLPKVKGHGNMKPIKKAKLMILLKAKTCYEYAMYLGYADAQPKVTYAEKLYQDNL